MLKTEQVGRYTVSQIGPLQGTRLRLFQRQLSEMKDDAETIEALGDWAVLAACVSPFISREEYLQTPVQELQPLMEAMERVNTTTITDGALVSKKKRLLKI
jgi:hypothetical protein